MARGGGGGGRDWRWDYWVWPLPPPGPVAFVCEWPAHGIALAPAELDAAVLQEAAGRAVAIWSEEEPFADIEELEGSDWPCT